MQLDTDDEHISNSVCRTVNKSTLVVVISLTFNILFILSCFSCLVLFNGGSGYDSQTYMRQNRNQTQTIRAFPETPETTQLHQPYTLTAIVVQHPNNDLNISTI